jgi:spore germination protein GerM
VTRTRWIQAASGLVLLGLLVFVVNRVLERTFAPPEVLTESTPPPDTSEVAHITATLFYASPDGSALVGVRREVPLASGPAGQGRAILDAQMQAAPDGYVSVIPRDTTIRGFYITGRQEAFVDFSSQLAAGHPGGSTTELLTVYAIVNAVTSNLPTVQRVQILIEGKEVDTLAGHVDLRRPLQADTTLVREPAPSP